MQHPPIPDPSAGLMFVYCDECKREMYSERVSHDDAAHGKISHGKCPVCCERFMMEAMDALASECHECDQRDQT